MNNILKSTKLDIELVRPYFKTICLTLLIPLAFVLINRSLFTGVSFAMSFIAMTTGYTFTITEKNSMDRLYGILPIRKNELVIGRYVFVVILGIFALIFSLITQPLILIALGERILITDIITTAIEGVVLFALYTVFQIPGYYKFGSIRGRVFMYIPVVGFLAVLLILSKAPDVNESLINSVGNSFILLILITFLMIIIMYSISIFTSIKIMKNMEL